MDYGQPKWQRMEVQDDPISIGQPIGRTRMTTPRESCRVASVNEESYLAFARKHYSRKVLEMNYDQWVRELVNPGVPLMTGMAIDMEIRHSLERAGVNVATT